MALENEVAALVTSTTALQNEVGSQLAKVRAENTTFQATVVGKATSAVNNGIVLFDGTSGKAIKNNTNATLNQFGGGTFDSVFIGLGSGVRSVTNCFVGSDPTKNTTGVCNSISGKIAFVNNTTGSHNTGFGFNALSSNTTGDRNTGIGLNTLLYSTTGTENTALGSNTLGLNITGNRNTAVGHWALNDSSGANYSNCTGLGCFTATSGSNQVQLGDSATTTFVYGTVQNRSDKRDKTDIRPTVLGLSFIKQLNPVDYRWDMRDFYRPSMPQPLTDSTSESDKLAYESALSAWQEANEFENLKPDGSKKKNRYHHGLIAQEIEALIKTTGQDFGGFQDHKRSGGQDVLSIGYDELIAPLIKAVQELAQANEDLRTRIAILEAGK